MMINQAKISTRLLTSNTYQFAGLPFGKKRVAVKADLDKYDVVIVGGHLGPLLSSHLDGVLGEKASIFVAFDNPKYFFNPLRGFYQKGLFTANEMQGSPKNSVAKFAASSDGLGVVEFLPNQNAVVLKGGRKVKYDQLVIATGLKEDPQSIKGFEQAWGDEEHPFYTNNNHPSWKFGSSKPYRWMYNFNGGEAIFYIPPAPYHGELQAYNFLQTKQLWERQNSHGRLCLQNSRFTVINANNSFCSHFGRADSFIRAEIEKKGINLEEGLKLIEIKKESNTAVFQNSKTGQVEERPYNNFYSLLPAKTDSILSSSGLADANGLLDVDPYTLQHIKYDNIFGLGDVVNVPTTKTFYAGFNQLSVVRHNVERRLNGLEPNAQYDGLSEVNFHVGYDSMTKISHLYNGEEKGSLSTGFVAGLQNILYTKQKGSIINLLKFKNWGPPYYKFKKTFGGSKSSSFSLKSLHPEKKQA